MLFVNTNTHLTTTANALKLISMVVMKWTKAEIVLCAEKEFWLTKEFVIAKIDALYKIAIFVLKIYKA